VRVKKKILGEDQNTRRRISSTRVKDFLRREKKNSRRRIFHREPVDWLSAKNFIVESFFLALGIFFKKSLFHFHFFLSSTSTYTNDIFKFDAILSLFAIFKNFT
jgi:hypothetical protein